MNAEANKTVIYPVTVQFEDVDSYNIVHHTKLVAYLERARVQFLIQRGFDFHDKNYEMVLYAISMIYKKTARFLDELGISVAVKSTETFKCTLAYRIIRGRDLIAKAETDIAFTDPETKEVIPIPDTLRL